MSYYCCNCNFTKKNLTNHVFFYFFRFLRASSSVQFSSSVIEESDKIKRFQLPDPEVGLTRQTYSSDTFPQRRRKRKRLEGFPILHQQQQQQRQEERRPTTKRPFLNLQLPLQQQYISNSNYSTLCVLQYFCSDLV